MVGSSAAVKDFPVLGKVLDQLAAGAAGPSLGSNQQALKFFRWGN